MAGVSAGTVDRILHNRGNVSQESREAVDKVLSEVGYKYNIHTSAISLKRVFKIVICTPHAQEGEYWGAVQDGFERAFEEFSDIAIHRIYNHYNPFDIHSYHAAFEKTCCEQPDAVIISPSFIQEATDLCRQLDKSFIPYVFIDSKIDETYPVASFSTDQYSCGRILAKILRSITPANRCLTILEAQHTGNQNFNTSIERKKGFLDYMESINQKGNVRISEFSVFDSASNDKLLSDFLSKNADVKGIAIMNSRVHIVADFLQSHGYNDIKVVSFDLTNNNRKCLQNGSIETLLCQRPEHQGVYAIKAIIKHLLYKSPQKLTHHVMPVDIIMKENLPYYNELFDI